MEPFDLDLRCTARTAKGKRCRLRPLPGLARCGVHSASAKGKSSARTGAAHRPDTITEDRTCQMEALLKAGTFVSVACEVVGIPPSIHDRWMQLGRAEDIPADHVHYRAYAQRIDRALAVGETNLVRTIASAGVEDWRAAAWLLERHHPERWGRRSVNGPSGRGDPDLGSTETPLADLVRSVRNGSIGHG